LADGEAGVAICFEATFPGFGSGFTTRPAYIVNPTIDSKGNPIGGCMGFLKSLQKVVRMFQPDEVVICWDGQGGSQRRKAQNKNYKAGRSPVRFNRRMYELSPEEQEKNKAYRDKHKERKKEYDKKRREAMKLTSS